MNQAVEKRPTTGPVAEHAILQDALRALKETTGTTARVVPTHPKLAEGRADAVVEIQQGGNRARYIVEIKRALPPAVLGHVVAQLQRFTTPGMLVTRYITPPMAERLRELNVAFLDVAGNAYINAPPFFVYVTGRKLPERDREAKKITLFRPTGLQVVFTLLCLPDLLNANYRQIAKAAGVALGTVGWAMYDLRGLGYLIERGKLKRKLVNKRKLLDAWVTAYAQQLRPKLFVGRFRAPRPDWWQNVDWRHFNAFLGGEAAAAKLTDYLKPERTTIYAAGDVNPFVLKYHLRKDTAGDVELIKAFWHFDDQGNYPDLVPPLLVYADLLATAKDRNIETGKLIYDQYLTRLVGED
jgi:hypothetical protein